MERDFGGTRLFVFSTIRVAVYYFKVGRIPLFNEEEVIQNVDFVHIEQGERSS